MYGLEEYGGGFESVGGEVKKFSKFEGEGYEGGREGSMAKRKTDLFEGGGVFRFAFWLGILKFSLLVWCVVWCVATLCWCTFVGVPLLVYYCFIVGKTVFCLLVFFLCCVRLITFYYRTSVECYYLYFVGLFLLVYS